MLEVRNLTVGYGETVVLRDISLSVGEGQVVALLGPNGAGKTTLLRAVAGFLEPRSGSVGIAGEDVTGLRPHGRARRGLCHIPEGRGIFPSLTVQENLVMHSRRGKEDAGIALAVETFPVLGRRLGQVAGSMSGGEQQMLALVRAYLNEPRLVLVDEPSMGLAPVVIDQIFRFLETLAATGTSLVIVEQYVARALELADRAYVLVRGRLVYSGSSAELADSDIFDTYLGVGAVAD